jgi:hypothetical protein
MEEDTNKEVVAWPQYAEKYCNLCGTKLKAQLVHERYNPHTGKPESAHVVYCPKWFCSHKNQKYNKYGIRVWGF